MNTNLLSMDHPGPSKMKKRKKMIKDPNAPKRFMTSFMWFSKDNRPDIKNRNPQWNVLEVAKELGRLWTEAAPEVKETYAAIATDDKERYLRELEEYNKTKAQVPADPFGWIGDEDSDEENLAPDTKGTLWGSTLDYICDVKEEESFQEPKPPRTKTTLPPKPVNNLPDKPKEWFGKVLPFISSHLSVSDILACRQVCKQWDKEIHFLVASHPYHQPYNENPLNGLPLNTAQINRKCPLFQLASPSPLLHFRTAEQINQFMLLTENQVQFGERSPIFGLTVSIDPVSDDGSLNPTPEAVSRTPSPMDTHVDDRSPSILSLDRTPEAVSLEPIAISIFMDPPSEGNKVREHYEQASLQLLRRFGREIKHLTISSNHNLETPTQFCKRLHSSLFLTPNLKSLSVRMDKQRDFKCQGTLKRLPPLPQLECLNLKLARCSTNVPRSICDALHTAYVSHAKSRVRRVGLPELMMYHCFLQHPPCFSKLTELELETSYEFPHYLLKRHKLQSSIQKVSVSGDDRMGLTTLMRNLKRLHIKVLDLSNAHDICDFRFGQPEIQLLHLHTLYIRDSPSLGYKFLSKLPALRKLEIWEAEKHNLKVGQIMWKRLTDLEEDFCDVTLEVHRMLYELPENEVGTFMFDLLPELESLELVIVHRRIKDGSWISEKFTRI